jgi:hypothetical protein
MSINPFDDNGSFLPWLTTRSNTAYGRPSPTFPPAGWQRAGILRRKPCGLGESDGI